MGSGPTPRVVVSEELTPTWRAAFDAYRPHRADPDAGHPAARRTPAARVRARGGRRARSSRSRAGTCRGGWLGVAAVWTRPEHRRQGLGTAVVLALGGWAARRGARWCYLQVETENAVAHAAYARLGFAHHHRYHYLAPAAG